MMHIIFKVIKLVVCIDLSLCTKQLLMLGIDFCDTTVTNIYPYLIEMNNKKPRSIFNRNEKQRA